MMKRLRGRNLAHPGCLIGVTTGLTLGIILAGVLAVLFNTPYNLLLLLWAALTFGLGAIGWISGTRLTTKYAAQDTGVELAPTVQSAPAELPPSP